jgi:L-rhamnose isomerase
MPLKSLDKLMRSKEPIKKSMNHKYKGLKENILILTEKKIFEHLNRKKIL